jgi:nicotinate-nucleotide--dimethylbenzimidazole phosphoribosyltransferase
VSIDLSELAARVLRPDDDARAAARARLAQITAPEAFGRFGELIEWIAGVQGQCPTHPLRLVRLIAIITPARSGNPALSPLLEFSAVTPRLVEVSTDDAEHAFATGMAAADEEVDGGVDLFIAAGLDTASTVPSAAAVAVLIGADVASVVGWGTGIDDREWMRRCAAVRDTARLARRTIAEGGDLLHLLSTLGSADLAATAGLLTQAAIRRTPVLLDGLVTTAAALLAHRLSPRTARWLLPADASPDPAHAAALDKLRLRPVVDNAISLEDGTAALLALPQLQAAATLLATER